MSILYVGKFKLQLKKTSESPNYFYQLIALLAIVLSIALQSFPTAIPSKYFWGSREPLSMVNAESIC